MQRTDTPLSTPKRQWSAGNPMKGGDPHEALAPSRRERLSRRPCLVLAWRPLFAPSHIYPSPQYVDPRHPARRLLDATLADLADGLCKIVQANFGEFTFHALR